MKRLHTFKVTSLADRKEFIQLWRSGLSARTISKVKGTSVTTVSRWLRRWRCEGNVSTKHRCGKQCEVFAATYNSLGNKGHIPAAEINSTFFTWILQMERYISLTKEKYYLNEKLFSHLSIPQYIPTSTLGISPSLFRILNKTKF